MHNLITLENHTPNSIAYGFISKTKAEIEQLSNEYAFLSQIHSPICIETNEPKNWNERIEADGHITSNRNTRLAIQTADCVPVLFHESTNTVIGACHAGWKGALKGILNSTIDMMLNKGAKLENITAIIGPAIQQKSYEVSSDYRDVFINETSENNSFFIPSSKEGHYLFDLPGYVMKKLSSCGIKTIINSGLDTLTNEDKFYSYRRSTSNGTEREGNILSIIGFNDAK